jgi:hypothetical protein
MDRLPQRHGSTGYRHQAHEGSRALGQFGQLLGDGGGEA